MISKEDIDFSGALKGLKVLGLDDLERYQDALKKGGQKGWTYYFPYLYFYSLPSRRALLIEEDAGSICIYVLRGLEEESGPRLQLYLSPFPFNEDVVIRAVKRMNDYNHRKTARILRVDEEDALKLQKINELNVETTHIEDEFIFDPSKYNDLSGGKLRNIRQQIGWISQLEDVKVVPYESKYYESCTELYHRWKKNQREKYESIIDGNYTKMCLLEFDKFSRKYLDGIVILIDNKVRSFGFYGAICEDIGSMFIGKSDNSIRGLQAFLKYQILLKMQNFKLANDSDGITQSLYDSKMKFRPVAMHKVYKARIR